MKAMKQFLLIFAVGSVLLPGCFPLREAQYVSSAKILIESADTTNETSEAEGEQALQAICAAEASEGTHAVFEKLNKSDNLWELRVFGPDPKLTMESCENVLNHYLSKPDSGRRRVLESPTIGRLSP